MAAPVVIPANAALRAAAGRTTVNIDTAGNIPIERYNVSETIFDIEIETHPYTVLLNHLGGVRRWDDLHRWYEDRALPQLDSLDGSVALDAATITVANGALFMVTDNVYLHAYRAQGHVTAKTGNVLTITWVVAPTVAVPDGTAVVRIGNSQEQIATPAPGPTTKETMHYNTFQTMFHECAFSNMQMHGNFRTKPVDPVRQQHKKEQEHNEAKEKTLLFGQQALWAAGVTGGSPMGHSQGLYYFIGTNVTSVGGVLTRAVFDNFLAGVMSGNTKSGQDWWLLCSTRVGMQISNWFSAMERETAAVKLFGIRVDTYRAPVHKDVKIMIHPMFDRDGYDDLAILINVGEQEAMHYVYHSVFDTKKYTGAQPYGRTAVEIFFYTIFTLEVKGEDVNAGVIEDIAAAA